MVKVVNFLKSLVFPKLMAKYKNMSALISVAILILICYLFSVPVGNFYAKNDDLFLKGSYDEAYSFVGINETNAVGDSYAKLDEISNEIKALDLKYENGKLSIGKADLVNKDYSRMFDEIKFTKTVVNDDKTEKTVTFVCHIGVYFDYDTDGDGSDTQVKFIDSDVYKAFNETSYNSDEKHFLMVLTQDSLYYQVGQIYAKDSVNYTSLSKENQAVIDSSYIVNVFYNQAILFSKFNISVSNLTKSGVSLLHELGYVVSFNYSMSYYQVFVLTTIIGSCLLFPLLLILLFWAIFKRNGNLKRFKEYINIAAISVIVPALLVFIISWFWITIVQYYIYVFALWYLIVIYKINSNQQLA